MTFNFRYPILGLGVAVCLLVSVTICLHVSSSAAGSSLCMPGLSIRCEPDDCGSLYVRCGRNHKRQEVPRGKVCYKGALISVESRMHSSGLLPHDCAGRTYDSRNSTIKFNLKACGNCKQCAGTQRCNCLCLSGGNQKYRCPKNGKSYDNRAQAECCIIGKCDRTKQDSSDVSPMPYWSWWTEAIDFGRVVISSSLKQICDSLRERFTFPPTMAADACCSEAAGCSC